MAGPVPTLLLRPEGSRDRNGVVSPTLSGGVLTVPGQYGQAWQVAEATTNYYQNPVAANGPMPFFGYAHVAISRIANAGMMHPVAGRIDTATRVQIMTMPSSAALVGTSYVASTLPKAAGQTITVQMLVRPSPGLEGKALTLQTMLNGGDPGQETSQTSFILNGDTYITHSHIVTGVGRTALYIYAQIPAGYQVVGEFVDVSAIQVEAKAYATSFAHGDMGPGFAWSGAAHASTSTRSEAQPYTTLVGRIAPSRGAVLTRYRRDTTAANGYAVIAGGLSGVTDQFYIAQRHFAQRVYLRDNQSAAQIDAGPDVIGWATSYLGWDETTITIDIGNGPISEPRQPFTDAWLVDRLYIGHYPGGFQINGLVESLIGFDRPLTPDERTQLMTMPRAWEWDALFPPDHPDLPGYRSRVFLLAPRIYTADRDNRLGSEITRHITHAAVDADIDRAGPKGQLQIAATDPAALPANGWIAPFLDVTHEDGTLDSAQMGLYQLDQPEITYDMTGQATAAATGVDIVGQLEAWPLGAAQTTAVGDPIMQDVTDGLTALGFRHSLPDDPRTATTAISHGANVSWLARFNDLLAAIGYHALYATADGRLTSRPLRDARQDTSARTYATGRDSAIVDPVTIRRAAGNLYNVVVAIKEDFQTGTALVAEARNDDPEHPWSTVALGREIAPPQPITVMEAVDQDALQAIADDRLARASMQETLAMDLLPDPTLAVHDVIEITGTDGPEGGRWSVESLAWGLTADSPLVRLGARRTYTTTSPEGA